MKRRFSLKNIIVAANYLGDVEYITNCEQVDLSTSFMSIVSIYRIYFLHMEIINKIFSAIRTFILGQTMYPWIIILNQGFLIIILIL